jgi:cobalt transporter subunit CbtA
MVSRTISIALLAGLLAGFCLFLIQRSSTVPLIHTAETYERAASSESAPDPFADEPMRSLSTLLGDVFVGIGFGLILTGFFAFTGKRGWLSGMLFGVAGFATFQLAPAMIVPPAVPGMGVASLLLRQTGWLVAVTSTIIGLVMIYNATGLAKLVGILFLFLPIIVFWAVLPIPPAATPSHSLALLDRAFVIRTLAGMLMFWLILGIVSGHLFARAGRGCAAPTAYRC